MTHFKYHTSNGINKPYLFKKLRVSQVFHIVYMLAGYSIALVAVSLIGAGLLTLLFLSLYTAWLLFYVKRARASNSQQDRHYWKAQAAYPKQPKALYDYNHFLNHITRD